jgi:hypothetical protein
VLCIEAGPSLVRFSEIPGSISVSFSQLFKVIRPARRISDMLIMLVLIFMMDRF